MRLEVLFGADDISGTVGQEILLIAGLQNEERRCVDHFVVGAAGNRLGLGGVEQIPGNGAGRGHTDLADEIAVVMVDLDIEWLGEGCLNAGMLDTDESCSFGGVSNEVGSVNRDLNRFEPVAADCKQADQCCKKQFFHDCNCLVNKNVNNSL